MGTPIINPWTFYYIDKLEILRAIFSYLAMGSPLFIAFLGIIYGLALSDNDELEEEEKDERISKFIKRCVIVAVFLGFLAFILPSKNTIYKMIVAREITYERIEKGKEVTKDLYDLIKKDIIDIVNNLMETNKNKK